MQPKNYLNKNTGNLLIYILMIWSNWLNLKFPLNKLKTVFVYCVRNYIKFAGILTVALGKCFYFDLRKVKI